MTASLDRAVEAGYPALMHALVNGSSNPDALRAALTAALPHLGVDREALLKDLRWRLDDIRSMLMTEGRDGSSIYGCDEWSTPTVNLQLAIDKIDKATGAAS
jgi:hypothetical protein